jgi:hypothetical protein
MSPRKPAPPADAPASPRRRGTPPAEATGPRVDHFAITSGALGPVGPCKLEIRPLTIFVGRQGTGKSLVSQVLYAFEELPFLAQLIAAKNRSKNSLGGEQIFALILDQLRSAERRFAAFAEDNLALNWHRGGSWEGVVPEHQTFSFRAYKATRQIKLLQPHVKLVDRLRAPATRPLRHAVFLPTERMVVSQLRSALAENLLSLPVTYELFADWLDRAAAALAGRRQRPEKAEREIAALSEQALGGTAMRVGTSWKWTFSSGEGENKKQHQFDLDMASSGQRANWSLGFLARALFLLRQDPHFANVITVFVEEPELHLHPAAEVAMAQILAILVKNGFRVVVTTHSLNFLYAINNLMLAARRFGDTAHKGLPPPSMRLPDSDVSVYAFPGEGRAPTSIIDRDQGFISEHELGDVGAELGAQMNYIGTLDLKER